MTTSEERARLLRDAAYVVLTLTSGASDAISFLVLGGAFTSVMTGNLVLLGAALVHPDPDMNPLQIGLAVAGYVGGTIAGARIVGNPAPDDPAWPSVATWGLVVEAGLFTVFAALWWVAGEHGNDVVQACLISLSAVAMGVQSSVLKRFGVSGFSTTYFTGTLTSMLVRLATGRRSREVGRNLFLLLSLVAGAVAATLLLRRASVFAPLAVLVPLVIVIAGVAVGASALGSGLGPKPG